jgi:hypothetical protein
LRRRRVVGTVAFSSFVFISSVVVIVLVLVKEEEGRGGRRRDVFFRGNEDDVVREDVGARAVHPLNSPNIITACSGDRCPSI